MKITTIDHKHYINLGDLDHLIRGIQHEIFSKYDRKDEDPTLNKDDTAVILTLIEIRKEIMHSLVQACETPDEVRELNERIEGEFYDGKYVVTVRDKGDDGKNRALFFKMFCKGPLAQKYREEGKSEEEIEELLEDVVGEPAFSEVSRDAVYFECYEYAESVASHIRQNYDGDVRVDPAWYYNRKAIKRMIDRILKEDAIMLEGQTCRRNTY